MGDAMSDAEQNGTNGTAGHTAPVPMGGPRRHPDVLAGPGAVPH
jgi:hypothetical protein